MKRPVFVVGCPRSGTTLLYSMLVAAGGFAFYRKETYFYDLVSRFPRLTSARSRQRSWIGFSRAIWGRCRAWMWRRLRERRSHSARRRASSFRG